MTRQAELRDFAVWDKNDLMRRLKAGETVTGFALDPDGQHLNSSWNGHIGLSPEISDHLKALADEQERFRRAYSYSSSVKDGIVSFSAGVGPRQLPQNTPPRPPEQPPMVTPLPAYPVVITMATISCPGSSMRSAGHSGRKRPWQLWRKPIRSSAMRNWRTSLMQRWLHLRPPLPGSSERNPNG